MPSTQISRAGWLAIGLAVLGGLLALLNEVVRYWRAEEVDWGHVALAVGVPALFYAVIRGASKRREG
jgi:hypothetical protein